jgi:hypothetical protein
MKTCTIGALSILASLSLGCVSACGVDAEGHDAFVKSPAYSATLSVVYTKLEPLFKKYYPSAVMTNTGVDGLCFEYAVTNYDFSVPVQPGDGAKHENPSQKGPRHGGILCKVYPEKGQYAGQLLLFPRGDGQYGPHLIDRKVYKQLLLAPYSAKRDVHLWVSLSYPPDASDDFLREFRALMNDFEKDAY